MSTTSSSEEDDGDAASAGRGVRKFWGNVNHIAIVVSDVGRSLEFYCDVIGMEQIQRPDFDRLSKIAVFLLQTNPRTDAELFRVCVHLRYALRFDL
jgi:catechol 2,3-dioxygenase-like lactoylglutathione lyase family enzyme